VTAWAAMNVRTYLSADGSSRQNIQPAALDALLAPRTVTSGQLGIITM
jgi:hypothetical protein